MGYFEKENSSSFKSVKLVVSIFSMDFIVTFNCDLGVVLKLC